MVKLSSVVNPSLVGRVVACCAVVWVFMPLLSLGGTPPKSTPAPAHPAPAQHAAAPAGQRPESAAGAGGAGGHGVTTGAAGGHQITTSNHSTVGARPGAAAPGHPAAGGSSAAFHGRPAPAGAHEMHAANGAEVRTRADGSRSDVHDPKRGMDIHHGLNGNRRIAVERADHSRIVAERGGRGYVQHPYMFHGHEFGHRTYFEHGRAYDRFYGRYPYHGRYLDVYAPRAYYPYGFYGYAYAPWGVPVAYAWGWGAAPWYGYYGAYYAPYPVYPAPAFWLTDFMIAASLQAAYDARAAGLVPVNGDGSLLALFSDLLGIESAEAAASPSPLLSPDTKQQVADEIKLMVQEEGAAAQANAAHQDIDSGANSVAHLLADNRPHVFVAGVDLDLVTAADQECAVSQGDVLRVSTAPAATADTASATILASKGGKECASLATVSVGIPDLQDMENHMRESIDDGLKELQQKQGQGGLPALPAGAAGAPTPTAFADGAPPPDANAAGDIAAQSSEADKAEAEAAAGMATAAGAGGPGSSTTIALGQSIAQVTAALGNPARIIDLGVKKIYSYPDMKVVFQNGKVSDVQ